MTFVYYLFIIFVCLLGLTIGSFINAVVFRLNKNMTLWDRSQCPKCHKKLGFWDLIPVLSFIFLGGKCRYCKKKISVQYPLVELITAIIFLLTFLRFKTDFLECDILSWINLVSLWFFGASLIIIFVSDLKYLIIPDKVLLISVLFGILVLISKSLISQSLNLAISHLFSIFLVFGFFLFLYLISRGKWIGAGDVKFGILLGLIIPWPQVLIMMLLSFVLGAFVGVFLILLRKKKLKDEIPFGTFLVAGTFLVIFFGDCILRWYLSLIGY